MGTWRGPGNATAAYGAGPRRSSWRVAAAPRTPVRSCPAGLCCCKTGPGPQNGRRRWAHRISGRRQTRGHVCKCRPPAHPVRSPGAAMPHPSPQRHQGGWGVAPSHLLAARGLQAAEARPKATPRIHMQMLMKTGFYLFPKFLKIEQPPQPNCQYQNVRLIITVQTVPGFSMRIPQSLKGSIKHQYGLFL